MKQRLLFALLCHLLLSSCGSGDDEIPLYLSSGYLKTNILSYNEDTIRLAYDFYMSNEYGPVDLSLLNSFHIEGIPWVSFFNDSVISLTTPQNVEPYSLVLLYDVSPSGFEIDLHEDLFREREGACRKILYPAHAPSNVGFMAFGESENPVLNNGFRNYAFDLQYNSTYFDQTLSELHHQAAGFCCGDGYTIVMTNPFAPLDSCIRFLSQSPSGLPRKEVILWTQTNTPTPSLTTWVSKFKNAGIKLNLISNGGNLSISNLAAETGGAVIHQGFTFDLDGEAMRNHLNGNGTIFRYYVTVVNNHPVIKFKPGSSIKTNVKYTYIDVFDRFDNETIEFTMPLRFILH